MEENYLTYENHTVTTKDGYKVMAYRIRTKDLKEGAPAVLFQHGLADSGDAWVVHHHQEAPAFVLAREGYDVWLANGRGTDVSRDHTHLNAGSALSAERKQYWDWSWQDLGKYENPAFIDLVRQVTGQKRITYIGHGQGTTSMFYGLCHPGKQHENYYKERLNLFVALAPTT